MMWGWSYYTYILSVVHDGRVVILHTTAVDGWGGVFLEVKLHPPLDVVVVDRDVAIAVWTSLFMMEADGMTQFMDDHAFLEEERDTFEL